MIAFMEYWGPYSFAGIHSEGDRMNLSLIDIAADKRGLLPPKDFVKLFCEVPGLAAPYLGIHNWGPGLLEEVQSGAFKGRSLDEGVVGKYLKGKQVMMLKAKTKEWVG